MSSVISKMGFVFSEQGFSKMLVPVCISVSVCCSAIGFVYQVYIIVHVVPTKLKFAFYMHLNLNVS